MKEAKLQTPTIREIISFESGNIFQKVKSFFSFEFTDIGRWFWWVLLPLYSILLALNWDNLNWALWVVVSLILSRVALFLLTVGVYVIFHTIAAIIIHKRTEVVFEEGWGWWLDVIFVREKVAWRRTNE